MIKECTEQQEPAVVQEQIMNAYWLLYEKMIVLWWWIDPEECDLHLLYGVRSCLQRMKR